MSKTPITSNPRFLLFPQVDRPDAPGKRPVVRRYSLTLLPSAGAGVPRSKHVTPAA
ncbi:MAG TPA: hypothetical protein VG165_01525 [Solirubrobacteraceae bacterium]|jgi:hypothetical protein|nr:hypothetical protein [Solirubrobacteraceae bacterium]